MKIKLIMNFFALLLLTTGILGCNESEDDGWVRDGRCYTVHVYNIDDQDIVHGKIINIPEGSNLWGECHVMFKKTDLQGQEIAVGNDYDIIISYYKEIPIEGFTTGETFYYNCIVDPYK
jgi:hypothetical protein